MNENKTNTGGRDATTGERESHPVGTGVGAAAGGVAGAAAGAATGAAAGTAGAGPIGTAVGAVAGAVIGGSAGHKVAEKREPLSATRSTDDGRYIGYTVIDRNKDKIGTVESVWLDSDGDPAYLAVRSGWLGMGRIHVVPAQSAEANDRERQIRVPYLVDQIKGAREFDSAADLQTTDEDRITSYYGRYGFRREGWLERHRQAGAGATAETARRVEGQGEARVQLKEEQV